MAQTAPADVAALVVEQFGGLVLGDVQAQSLFAQIATRYNMGTKQERLAVVDTLPTAGFVTAGAVDSTGQKPSGPVKFTAKDMTVATLAGITTYSNEDIADITIDLLANTRPLLSQKLAQVLDMAVFFGLGKPAEWAEAGLSAGALAATQDAVIAAAPATIVDAVSAAVGMLEAKGLDADVIVAKRGFRGALRNLKNTQGNYLIGTDITSGQPYDSIFGIPIKYMPWWDATSKAVAFVIDSTGVAYGARQDVTFATSGEAVIGGVSLFEYNRTALRAEMRAAFTTVQPVDPSGVKGYPVATVSGATVAPFGETNEPEFVATNAGPETAPAKAANGK
jgi:HK97 family phage major capsid protein